MDKPLLSLDFIYSRETKKFFIYNLETNHEFFPKSVYITKSDLNNKPISKIMINLVTKGD